MDVIEVASGLALTNAKFASAFRARLLGAGRSQRSAVQLLKGTSCFRHLMHHLASALSSQHGEELKEIGRDSRLKFSELTQALALLAFELNLDAVVEDETEESESWTWLREYCNAMRALKALAADGGCREERVKEEAALRRIVAKYRAKRGERADPVFNYSR